MNQEELINEARNLLADIGMDEERYNERSAMTFLALAHLDTQSKWINASNEMYTTRQLMD